MNTIKFKIVGLCICLFVISNNIQAQKTITSVASSYTLEATIKGLEDGITVKLTPGATHSSDPAVAETIVKNGKFVFSGSLAEPRLYYLVFGKNQGFISVMLENSKMNLTSNAEMGSDENKRITFKNTVFTGSKSDAYFKKETAYRGDLDKAYAAYHTKESDEVSKLIGEARKEKETKKLDSLQNLPVWKKFEADEKAFFTNVEKSMTDLIVRHKDSWWGPFFMMSQFSYLTPQQKPLFDQFSETAKNSYYGKLADAEVNPKSLVGTSVAAFELKDKEGKSVSIKDIANRKEYILIDFWASWCAPCRKEIPNLKKAYTEFAAKGFEILSISTDDNQKAWNTALTKENMSWPNLLDNDVVSKSFNVKAIPATFLMDKNGTIIATDLRGEALEAKLKELLKS
ncbi:TlpA disulfide reductase family protein [Flavobacterium agrisoli]|uniref:AhpC/TSA family protein n=1 Tax=Flavobacterium agrisoli TaxID=2793066 RepID=A0A934PL15_9FLAO|nr:TlpA disulfide reductase family protein [Flavobacterium agrisoli]MBK0368779.1 AhpC/TSA family protein [Flavobacterium agrisoli]